MAGIFSQRVWELATSIPPGRVTTYGILARAAGGGAQSARSITSVLSKAPNQKAIPYHRIVYSDGRAWVNEECRARRIKLFRREGITLDARDRINDFADVLYHFDDYN